MEQIAARLKELAEKFRDGTATADDDAEYKRLKFMALLATSRKVMG